MSFQRLKWKPDCSSPEMCSCCSHTAEVTNALEASYREIDRLVARLKEAEGIIEWINAESKGEVELARAWLEKMRGEE